MQNIITRRKINVAVTPNDANEVGIRLPCSDSANLFL